MKKFIGVISVLLILSVSAFGSPVYFKITKEIKSDNDKLIEIATVDVSKFKQIRVGIIISLNDRLKPSRNVIIEAAEGEDFIKIGDIEYSLMDSSGTITLENLPNKIRISARSSGTYKVFIWAQ